MIVPVGGFPEERKMGYIRIAILAEGFRTVKFGYKTEGGTSKGPPTGVKWYQRALI